MNDPTASDTDLNPIKLAQSAADIIDHQVRAVEQYLKRSEESGRVVLQKRDVGAPLDRNDPTDGATSTAFAVSRLARATRRSVMDGNQAEPPGISRDAWASLAETIVADFCRTYADDELAAGVGAKAAGDLPNYYSTPLHLSGVLAVADQTTEGASPGLARSVQRVTSVLVDWLRAEPFVSGESLKSAPGSGHVDELLALADGSPNWYLTYLIVDALSDVLRSPFAASLDDLDDVVRTLDRARAGGLLALARMIALSSAGLSGIFDALDLGGCLATIGRCVESTSRADLITSRLLNRGIDLLGREFLTPYGAFAPKGPAMVDRSGVLLEISSSELAEAVMNSLFDMLEDDRVTALVPAVRLTCQRVEGHRGWGEANHGGADRRDVFATSSSLALLSQFTTRMDQILHRQACSALDVEPPPKMANVAYPQGLGEVIQRKVIQPIADGRRDLAAMSLLLYGPPGTAKTTIARKIASDLEWPILELTPSRLLLTGFEEITSRAEDLFGLLSNLRNVVVLFDEFEGFIGRRDNDGASDASKFLTTFMLPKLHRLRDSGQVVFVVATNDEAAIDSAASRPGRIDTLLSVEPPSVDEVRQVILTFAKRIRPIKPLDHEWDGLWAAVSDGSDANQISGLTYGYINRWVKDVALEFDEAYSTERTINRLEDLKERLRREQSAGKNKK